MTKPTCLPGRSRSMVVNAVERGGDRFIFLVLTNRTGCRRQSIAASCDHNRSKRREHLVWAAEKFACQPVEIAIERARIDEAVQPVEEVLLAHLDAHMRRATV